MSRSQKSIFVAGLAAITVSLLFPFLKETFFDKGSGYYFLFSEPVMDAIFGEQPEYRYPLARNLLPPLFITFGIAVIAIRKKSNPDPPHSPATPGQPAEVEKE